MNDDEDGVSEGVRRWAELITKRGHAGVFARQNAADKQVVERMTTAEWAESVRVEFGIRVDRLEQPDADPPDMIAEFDGARRSLELVELVDERQLRGTNSSKKPRDLAVWDEHRFRSELTLLIGRKRTKYGTQRVFDILLVHTDEPWLRAHEIRRWLGARPLDRCASFRSA